MTNKKVTKKDNYSALITIIDTMEQNGVALDLGEDITYDSLREFLNNELQLLENKALAAKKRAEEKKAEGDALRETIYEMVDDDWTTIDTIVSAINDPDVTKNMVTSRLGQLIKLGSVEKEVQSVPATAEGGKARKISVYRRIYQG